jgi:hypothetical protein
MDLKIHRPQGTCRVTGRPFVPGELFHSALVREAGGIQRVDVCADAWSGPPAGTLAAWRSAFPSAASGPTLAPVDVLLDLLEELEGRADEAALRYLLALELVRRRVLKMSDAPPDTAAPAEPESRARAARSGATRELVLICRRRDREYRVPEATPDAALVVEVGQRLTALLWSGEAA